MWGEDGSAFQDPAWAEWMVPKKLFQLGWWLVLLSFGSFEISEESGVGAGPALALLLPSMGHFFHTPHPRNPVDVLRQGKEGQGGALLPSGFGGSGSLSHRKLMAGGQWVPPQTPIQAPHKGSSSRVWPGGERVPEVEPHGAPRGGGISPQNCSTLGPAASRG